MLSDSPDKLSPLGLGPGWAWLGMIIRLPSSRLETRLWLVHLPQHETTTRRVSSHLQPRLSGLIQRAPLPT